MIFWFLYAKGDKYTEGGKISAHPQESQVKWSFSDLLFEQAKTTKKIHKISLTFNCASGEMQPSLLYFLYKKY